MGLLGGNEGSFGERIARSREGWEVVLVRDGVDARNCDLAFGSAIWLDLSVLPEDCAGGEGDWEGEVGWARSCRVVEGTPERGEIDFAS